MAQKITILIVDDHPLLRRGLGDVIAAHPRFRIVGEASDGAPPIPPQDATGDLDDIYNKARAERWTVDRLNDESFFETH